MFISDVGGEEMEEVGGMIYKGLQSAIPVREGLCGRAKGHLGAEVVPSVEAVLAVMAVDTTFDSDSVADLDVLNSCLFCFD